MPIILNSSSMEYYFDSEGCYITELLNSDADSALSIARARVCPGVTTTWHRLKHTTERYYILSGSGIVEVGDEAAQAVTAGDVVVIAPMQRQRIHNNTDEDLVFLAICTPRFQVQNYQSVT